MVDTIKSLPPLPISFPLKTQRLQNKSTYEQIFFSNIKNLSQSDRLINIKNTKRWIGRCPGDPARQINIFNTPYNLHQKVIHHELTRYNLPPPTTTTTVDATVPIKIKQQTQKNCNKELLKATTIGIGTTVLSNSFLSNIDTQNSRLFESLSKHVIIKSEPLRPGNNFLNDSLPTWHNYWTSTHTQRRRKQINNDSESILFSTKHNQPLVATTNFFTVHNSSFYSNTEINSSSRTSSPISDNYTPIKSDKQSSFIKEDNQFSSSRKQTPIMTNSFKSIEEKSLSIIQSESTIINNDDDNKNKKLENDINKLTTKIYKLPLPTTTTVKPKINKSILIKKGSETKILEKKTIISSTLSEKKQITTSLPNTSVPKRKRQSTLNKSNQSTTKKPQSLSTVIKTTSKSKYQHNKWAEPYVGVRYDPPTPPCSPSLCIYPQDSDQDENEHTLINDVYL